MRTVTAALAVAAALAAAAPATTDAARPAPAATCQEDQACWVWSTHGNRQRGVVLTDGRRVVVGPGRFARLDRTGRIDWRATPRLRGDHTARTQHACR